MIDTSLPRYPIYLYKTDTKSYPKYDLPDGYTVKTYTKGDEREWARLECELGQFENVESALEAFGKSFLEGQRLLPEDRVMFVLNECGEYVATCALWDGEYLGRICQRVHWLAVSDKCAGRGIAKALICRVLDLYNSLGYEGFIYLLTGVRYYPAIGIYKKFGFVAYDGERSLVGDMTDEEFVCRHKEAVAIVENKLNCYKTEV